MQAGGLQNLLLVGLKALVLSGKKMIEFILNNVRPLSLGDESVKAGLGKYIQTVKTAQGMFVSLSLSLSLSMERNTSLGIVFSPSYRETDRYGAQGYGSNERPTPNLLLEKFY